QQIEHRKVPISDTGIASTTISVKKSPPALQKRRFRYDHRQQGQRQRDADLFDRRPATKRVLSSFSPLPGEIRRKASVPGG
ncbi:hypothetical protein ACJ8BV_01990, partial [Klebsiella pneumoniae]